MSITQIPDSFKEGYRIIMLLYRNKDGGEGNAQRRAIKRVSSTPEEWQAIVDEFVALKRQQFPTHRIYASANARDPIKAIHEFKRRQLECDFGNEAELLNFYKDIKNRFVSCLANPGCKKESYFLIDCDTEEQYENAKMQIKEDLIVFEYPTKSGNHIITKPFNPNEYSGIDIKKDDLIYIG